MKPTFPPASRPGSVVVPKVPLLRAVSAPGLDHGWDRLRLDQAVMRMFAQGRVVFRKLSRTALRFGGADRLRHFAPFATGCAADHRRFSGLTG
jgi:hypothetical protein